MASAVSDIKYIRSNVEFISISSVKDIIASNSITVGWRINTKYKDDVTSLYLLRAVLDPGEKADLSKDSIRNKFRLIYKWDINDTSNGGSPVTTFTDAFKWDDASDSNLHNLNCMNDANWTQRKFADSIRRIVSGEQGIIYKIFGYSRRMSRSATPLGFFCDGPNIVALSQKNQVVNDKWFSEGGTVWKSGSDILESESGELFVRVAVDLNRDLGEKPKKRRNVWASTNKGRVVLFDYWTGKIRGSKKVNSNDAPIYSIAYDALNNYCVLYNGQGSIYALYDDVTKIVDTIVTKKTISSLVDIMSTVDFAKREMGGVCAVERDSSSVPESYFYFIVNRETVHKYRILSNDIKLVERLGRNHFGCTSTYRKTGESYDSLISPGLNQDNVYGIGVGVNGHVWANGHTPLSVFSSNIKPAGNPVRIKIRVGRGRSLTAGDPAIHESGMGCANVHGVSRGVFQGKDDQWNNLISEDGIWYGESNDGKLDGVDWSAIATTKTFGQNDNTCDGDWIDKVWDYSARMCGVGRRTHEYAKQVNLNWGGCSLGFRSAAGVNFLNWCIQTNPSLDNRQMGKGTTITLDSVSAFPSGGPENNDPQVIFRIHQELVSIEDDTARMDDTANGFLQDLNYVYGCTSGENYNDSNGQIEDLQNYDSSGSDNYRWMISQNPDSSVNYFSTTTKWLTNPNGYDEVNYNNVYLKMFGWADLPYKLNLNTGEPVTADAKGLDKGVGKPKTRRVTDEWAYGHSMRFYDVYNYKIDGTWHPNPGKYEKNLPFSVGTIATRVPADGRLFISKYLQNAYRAGNDKVNRIEYDMFFADRREGKIGVLNYDRASGNPADTSMSPVNRRVKYSSAEKENQQDDDREFFFYDGSFNDSKYDVMNTVPYHVSVDSDNNLWYATASGIGKFQFLTENSGRYDKYVYDKKTGAGLYAWENNNTMLESSIYLLNVHASSGANINRINPKGIKNGTKVDGYDAYREVVSWLDDDKRLTIAASGTSNRAYLYNIDEWRKGNLGGVWDTDLNPFNTGGGIYNNCYVKDGNESNQFTSDSEDDDYYNGLIDNEFNDDNFGLSCLYQTNSVELGPDIVHPKILSPQAKTMISSSISKSHNDICDTFDGSGYWNAHTEIFDGNQSTSGFDDLETVHTVYDIKSNYRKMYDHRYEYIDASLPGGKYEVSHDFSYDDSGDLIGLDNIYDSSPDIVWKTPNYTNVIPPYDLKRLSASSGYSQNYVDLYLDFAPSVYNLYKAQSEKEYLHIGKHRVHVFERWPTSDFCLRGVGNAEMTDVRTDYDLVGRLAWGDCVNITDNDKKRYFGEIDQ